MVGPTEPGDVWLLDGSGDAMARATTVNVDVADRFRLPEVEAIQWPGEDGVTVEGLLYYPLDYASGARHPLVVQTHGGPASSDRFRFPSSNNYETVLTSLGYFVSSSSPTTAAAPATATTFCATWWATTLTRRTGT